MAYTEIKKRNGKKYYYRVISIRKGKKVSKIRKYLGVDLSEKERILKEDKADKEFGLTKKNKKENSTKKIKPKIIKILKKHHIKRAGIFGSYARGEQKKNSDIDILVEPAEGMGLEFIGIKLELEDKLGRKIDLVTYKGIHPLLKKQILKEEVKIIWKFL